MKKKLSKTLSIAAIRQSFKIVKKTSPNLVFFNIVENLWTGLQPMIGSGITSLGIIMITNLNKDQNKAWGMVFIITVSAWLAISQLINELDQYFSDLRSERDFQEQKTFVQEKLDQLDPAQFFSNDLNRTKRHFLNKGWRSMTSLYDKTFTMGEKTISFIASTTVIAILSPWVIIFALIPGIFSAISNIRTHRKVLDIWEDGHDDRTMFEEYNELTSNNKSVLQTIFHGTRNYFKGRFYEKRNDINNDFLKMQKILQKRRVVFAMINIICTSASLSFMCFSAMHGKITIITWPIAFAALFTIKNSISIFGVTFSNFINSLNEYEKYFIPFVELQPMYTEGQTSVQSVLPIIFNDVTFTYPNKHKPAIEKLSTTISLGEIVGLVGSNGGGKTTIINLIAGVYFPQEGQITLGSINSKDIRRESLLSHMLIESVYNGLPDTTIREIVSASLNVKNDLNIWEALKIVGMFEFVNELPNQLDTYIGEQWEGGIQLSTGQNKRMSLASLYFKSSNPEIQIILLDEPMGNIDPETKKDFYSKITEGILFPGKAVVVCLHDEQYEPLFQKVICIESGELVERGLDNSEFISLVSLIHRSDQVPCLVG